MSKTHETLCTQLRLIRLADLPMPSTLEVAADEAETAALILRRIAAGEYDPGRLGSVTWRLADVLHQLRNTGDELPGIHRPTGRGAQLKQHEPEFTE